MRLQLEYLTTLLALLVLILLEHREHILTTKRTRISLVKFRLI